MQRLAETFSAERSRLESQWDNDEDVSTRICGSRSSATAPSSTGSSPPEQLRRGVPANWAVRAHPAAVRVRSRRGRAGLHAARGLGPPRALGRKRQAGGLLLRARARLHRVAYAGPETGVRDRASYVLEQGEIRLVLTSGLRADSEIVRVRRAGTATARDIALRVPDAGAAYREAVAARRHAASPSRAGSRTTRPRRARVDRHLRRDRAHVRRPRRLRGPVPARLRLARRRTAAAAAASA